MKTTLILLIAAMLPLAGCISNLDDLTGKSGGNTSESVQPAAIDDATNTSTPPEPVVAKKAPVARVSAFGANGALVFKSTFTAEDPVAIIFVEEKSAVKLIAGDSETLEPGATFTQFQWTLNGKPLEGARQATAQVDGAGLYVVTLTVTDTNGKGDDQTIKLGVAPKPVDVITELVTGPIAGAEGAGQNATLPFDLTLDGAGVPATITAVKFHAAPPATCDAILEVVGPDETSLGVKDDTSFGEAEEITAGALAPGVYTISITPFACAAPDGIPVTITVTYLPTVQGIATGDGHGGHTH
jgi:hypothetical protein